MRRVPLIVAFWGMIAMAAIPVVASNDANGQKLWNNMCASCHNGSTAPDREALREKYKTIKQFQKAVYHKGDRCMNVLKNDKALMIKVGREIGLKE